MRMHLAQTMLIAFFAMLFAAGLGSATSMAQASSTFDTDVDGWTAAGDFASPLTWVAVDGNPDGTVSILDAVIGGVTYFVASAKFLGNHSDAYGKALTFDLRQVIGAPSQFSNNNDVILVGAGITLVYDTPANPAVDGTWTSYVVPLTEAGWRIGNSGGVAATKVQMQSALAAITGLRIRAEYQSGPDTDYLDNVNLAGATVFTTIENACGTNLPAALFATGTLQPFSPVTLSLLGAASNAQTVLMLGTQPATLTREGCSLVFMPSFLLTGTTDGSGSTQFGGSWPDNVPPGFVLYAQAYILDVSLSKGFETSNTVLMTSP